MGKIETSYKQMKATSRDKMTQGNEFIEMTIQTHMWFKR